MGAPRIEKLVPLFKFLEIENYFLSKDPARHKTPEVKMHKFWMLGIILVWGQSNVGFLL